MQRVHCIYYSCTHINGIDSQVRLGAVCCLTPHFCFDQGTGRPADLGNDLPCPGHVHGHYMKSEQVINIVCNTCVDHGKGAFADLFRRLEQNFQFPTGNPFFCQPFRRGKHRSHVTVMAAGVNGFFRTVFLFEQKAVHVTAKGSYRSGFPAVQDANYRRGATNLFLHSIPCLTQNLRNKGGGFYFAESRFGNRMQVRP